MNDPTVQADGGRVGRWLGAKSYSGALGILLDGNFSPASDSGHNFVQFNHVWVEACVPYGRYRGAALDTTGERWIELDSSVKDATYQAGIAINVNFDYAGLLAKRLNGPNSLPSEIFAQQVLNAARSSNPAASLDNISYDGTLKSLTLDILPASLPYDVVSYTNWPGSSSPETAQLPSAHRYRLAIGGLGLSAAYNLYLPDISLSRLTLAFKGATGTDQSSLDSFRIDGNPASSIPCSINVVPVLRVDGQDQGITGSSVGLCTTNNSLTLGVYLDEIPKWSELNAVSYNNIGAANVHALQAYSFQISDALLAARNANLLAAVAATPDPNASADTLDATEGEYLNLIGLKYMAHVRDALKQIGALSGSSGESGSHLGLASSQMKVQYLFDLPYAVNRSGFLVDMPGMVSRDVDLTLGTPSWPQFKLGGYTGSALESYVWQENAQLDAVSTVRGLQFANETGIGTFTANASNWASVRAQLSVYPGSSSNDCTSSPSTLQYPRCIIDSTTTGIQALINLGYTVTLPTSLIQYGDWKGTVYEAERQTANAADTRCPGSFCSSYIISGLHGGYTLGSILNDAMFNPSLNTGYLTSPELPADLINFLTSSSNIDSIPPNSVTSINGPPVTSAADPVNMLTGNVYHNETDISIKGRGGLPIVFARAYNSRTPQDGPLGFGWTHSFNQMLKFYGVDSGSAKVSWIDGSGAERYFATTAQSNGDLTLNTTIPNPAGVFVTFTRNVDGSYSIREKNGLTYRFESATGPSGATTTATPVYARLLSITDRNNNALTLNYSGGNCGTSVCSITDSIGRSVLSFHYNGTHIDQITDLSGRSWHYTVDTNGNLITFANPLAVSGTQPPVSYSYYAATDGTNLAHAMKQYTLPRGNGMRFEYYENGRAFRQTVVNVDGSLSTDKINAFTYNDFRRESVQTNERGMDRHFFFDANGNPLSIVEENGGEYDYAYTQSGQPFLRTACTDPLGLTTQYAYDTNGNLTQVTQPRGATVQYGSYNSFAQPQTVKDARGNSTVFKYDSHGNLTERLVLKASAPAPVVPYTPSSSQVLAWTVNGYDAYGNLTSTKPVRDIAGQIAAPTATSNTGPIFGLAYDSNGLNATTSSRTGLFNNASSVTTQSATLSYDNLGRLTSGIDASWQATQFSYDALDRITQATDRLGNLRNYSFDANGNSVGQRLVVAGSQLDSSASSYDDADRVSTRTDAGGNVTLMNYDAAGNLTSVTNPDNYSLSFTYDELNHAVSAADQEGHSVSTQRDAAGRPLYVTDPNGHVTNYAYWDASRDGALQSVTRPAIQGFTSGVAQSFDYDANGNRIITTEIPAGGSPLASRTTLVTYDELNRPLRVAGPQYTDALYGAICPVTVNTYDALGRVSQVAAGRTPAPCSDATQDIVTLQMTDAFDDFSRKISETDALSRVCGNTVSMPTTICKAAPTPRARRQLTLGLTVTSWPHAPNKGDVNPRGRAMRWVSRSISRTRKRTTAIPTIRPTAWRASPTAVATRR